MKSGFYKTISDDQFSSWTKKFQSTSESQTSTTHTHTHTHTYTKRSWSLFGGLLTIWSTTAFWIPVKPLHVRSMLSKLMRCIESCKACSQQWSTEWAKFFSITMPHHTSHNWCFKSWRNWATMFCFNCHIHLTSLQLTITPSSISATFCSKNASTTIRKFFLRVCWIPKHELLCYRNKPAYFSLAKMCWI